MARFFKAKGRASGVGSDALNVLRSHLSAFIKDVSLLRGGISNWMEVQKHFFQSCSQSTQELTLADESLSPLSTFLTEAVQLRENSTISMLQDILCSIDKKLKLLERLEAQFNKLFLLSTQRTKRQRKLLELQKKGDLDSMSKASKELSTLNEEFKHLELEVSAKMEFILNGCSSQSKENSDIPQAGFAGKFICASETILFKKVQQKLFSTLSDLFQHTESKTESNSLDSLNLMDEFIKFEMSMEANVVERKRRLATERSNPELVYSPEHASVNVAVSSPKSPQKAATSNSRTGKRQSLSSVPVYHSLLTGFKAGKPAKSQPPPAPQNPPPMPDLSSAKISIIAKTETVEIVDTVGKENAKSSDTNVEEKYVAVYPYMPQHEDEIELRQFDVLMVEDKGKDGWFTGRNLTSSKHGLFPGNYCQEYTEE